MCVSDFSFNEVLKRFIFDIKHETVVKVLRLQKKIIKMYFLFHNQILSKVLSMGSLTKYLNKLFSCYSECHDLQFTSFSLLIQLFMS